MCYLILQFLYNPLPYNHSHHDGPSYINHCESRATWDPRHSSVAENSLSSHLSYEPLPQHLRHPLLSPLVAFPTSNGNNNNNNNNNNMPCPQKASLNPHLETMPNFGGPGYNRTRAQKRRILQLSNDEVITTTTHIMTNHPISITSFFCFLGTALFNLHFIVW